MYNKTLSICSIKLFCKALDNLRKRVSLSISRLTHDSLVGLAPLWFRSLSRRRTCSYRETSILLTWNLIKSSSKSKSRSLSSKDWTRRSRIKRKRKRMKTSWTWRDLERSTRMQTIQNSHPLRSTRLRRKCQGNLRKREHLRQVLNRSGRKRLSTCEFPLN